MEPGRPRTGREAGYGLGPGGLRAPRHPPRPGVRAPHLQVTETASGRGRLRVVGRGRAAASTPSSPRRPRSGARPACRPRAGRSVASTQWEAGGRAGGFPEALASLELPPGGQPCPSWAALRPSGRGAPRPPAEPDREAEGAPRSASPPGPAGERAGPDEGGGAAVLSGSKPVPRGKGRGRPLGKGRGGIHGRGCWREGAGRRPWAGRGGRNLVPCRRVKQLRPLQDSRFSARPAPRAPRRCRCAPGPLSEPPALAQPPGFFLPSGTSPRLWRGPRAAGSPQLAVSQTQGRGVPAKLALSWGARGL